jgi:hypothetical protein
MTDAVWECVRKEGEGVGQEGGWVLKVFLPKPEGNWQIKACLGVDMMVESLGGGPGVTQK